MRTKTLTDSTTGHKALRAVQSRPRVGTVKAQKEDRRVHPVSVAADVPVGVGEILDGLDRGLVELALAAFAHASGSHEHSDVVDNADGTTSFGRLPSLYPWPEEPGNGA